MFLFLELFLDEHAIVLRYEPLDRIWWTTWSYWNKFLEFGPALNSPQV